MEAGFSKEELVTSGLVKLRDEGNPRSDVYDRFRDRLMFPITNELGEVVAFSGRVLQPNAPGGKYINSPESPLFSKGNLLFGLEKSKRAIAHAHQAVVLEGQVDLIVAFAAGIENVVAPLGTALTERHASLLKRFATEAVLFFDADTAGERAAERAIEVLYAAGLQVRLGRYRQVKIPIRYCGRKAQSNFDSASLKRRIFSSTNSIVAPPETRASLNGLSRRTGLHVLLD